ncbi:Lrp/AsnC family transcriptional regulator [Haloterrigena sp. SYSU A558-1]|uniref:siroheme decarboxylase n=1 Tax=Haloterrigena gelatinilytica TaxID=2741724 RepID=A0A8J8GHK8_9EURY|nr:Lrp/AsnC family transcriptional regulator [Haloterrigena gelatinilytica]NUB89551.1 Lrp/AsnC family transcriptional regulator [Haloterrigena gelatinilytica]NUC74618.1 Lrp/AsnC family transcriptional regulator [Haloterrigena gelatinilytica]
MTTDVDLTERERAVVNAFQGGFPVTERPFEPAAAAMRDRGVDITADELLETIHDLDERGVLSRFGPLVNAQEIGGAATLVAMHAPEDRFDEIVEQVNAHREVAHNYEREHPHLNVWFVVSVADEDRVDEVLAEIEDETGQETYNLPKQREFRVEAKFYVDGPLDGDGDVERAGVDCTDLGPDVATADSETLSPAERDLLLEVQDGLPLTETPYADVADAVGQETEWVLETINRFEREGKIRRIGVVPNHYALGYTENGMTVWNVPDDRVEEVGPEIAALPFVTHCYERPRHEGVWPYNFFAMTHGRSEAESRRRIEQVRERMDDYWDVTADDWDTLHSTQILKKTGIRLDERADANTEAE